MNCTELFLNSLKRIRVVMSITGGLGVSPTAPPKTIPIRANRDPS